MALAVDAYEELSSRRGEGARRQPALLVPVRPPGRRVPREVLPPAVQARVAVEQASTLGWDRYVGPQGRDRRHAHLRRVRAPEGRPAQVRLHPRARWPRQRKERTLRAMKPTQAAARPRPEPLARQHHPHDARRRHARALHRRALGHRPDLEPDDLRQGDRRRRRLRRRRSPSCSEKGLEARSFLRAGARGPARAPPSCSRAIHERDRRRRRLGLARGLAAARLRRPGDDRAGRRRSTSARTRQPLHQDPRARPRDCRRSRSRSSPASRSTSRCCSRPTSTSPPPTPTCEGIERRIEAGLDPDVRSVASLFISRWDVAVADEVPDELRNRLGIAVGKHAYRAYRELLDSDRWQRLADEGARPQRLLFASTGTKDPRPPTPSTSRRSRRRTRSTRCPTRRSQAFADHGEVGDPMPADGGDADEVLAAVRGRGHRHGRARRPAPAGGQGVVQQVLERPLGIDRVGVPQTGDHRVSRPRQSGAAPERSYAMQLGMVGLGRMGANMVRRLMTAGHDCVVYDVSPGLRRSRARRRGRRPASDVAGRTSSASSSKPRPSG